MDNITEIPFFIIHYTHLTDRKVFLSKQLELMGIKNIEWVTEKEISHYNVTKVYDPSIERFKKRVSTDFGKLIKCDYMHLKRNEIEVTIQHFEALTRIHQRGLENAIILEDDVVFERNFVKRMNRYNKQLPMDYDIFYFGRGCGALHIKRNISEKIQGAFYKKNVFKRYNFQSRYADSYMVSKKALGKFIPPFESFQCPIDWEMNYLQIKYEMNIYWGEPTLSSQGSSIGKYKSGLR